MKENPASGFKNFNFCEWSHCMKCILLEYFRNVIFHYTQSGYFKNFYLCCFISLDNLITIVITNFIRTDPRFGDTRNAIYKAMLYNLLEALKSLSLLCMYCWLYLKYSEMKKLVLKNVAFYTFCTLTLQLVFFTEISYVTLMMIICIVCKQLYKL